MSCGCATGEPVRQTAPAASADGRPPTETAPARAPHPPAVFPRVRLRDRLRALWRWLRDGTVPACGRLPDGRRYLFDGHGLLIEGDLELRCTGTLVLSADRHLFVESGPGAAADGRPWAIHLNGPREGMRPWVRETDGTWRLRPAEPAATKVTPVDH